MIAAVRRRERPDPEVAGRRVRELAAFYGIPAPSTWRALWDLIWRRVSDGTRGLGGTRND